MKTSIPESVTATTDGRRMTDILHTCVHCGMCNATCPTYQLVGDELDGPRGRIYLIKSMLEGEELSAKTQHHLDRCLTCRSCETTCPSGVKYGELVELARPWVDEQVPRKPLDKLRRWLIKKIVPYPGRFRLAVRLGAVFKPILPQRLAESVPSCSSATAAVESGHARNMLLLAGCAQSVVAPSINQAACEIFDRLGIALSASKSAGCCGAVDFHLNNVAQAKARARANIDAWWPGIEAGAESILITSSGCAVMVQQYPQLFQNDPDYLGKAERVARLVADPAEKIDIEKLKEIVGGTEQTRVAFQAPCTMQHGSHADVHVRKCLQVAGFDLTLVSDPHLCCGSAGSYSLLQPELSAQLLDNKLDALTGDNPEMVLTANIGCYMHLKRRSPVPVKHWLEVLEARAVKAHR
ncbi:MAG: glycolate oxidase subunit GlcF [Gammaproteobacteria bacterium]